MDRDRNLLFGVFAVQLRKVEPSQLRAAAGAWAADPSKDLPERLVQDGVLSAKDRDFIGRLVEEAVRAHGGDVAASLTTLGGEEQIALSFAGSIRITDEGGIEMVAAPPEMREYVEGGSVPGVMETPGRYTRQSEYARGGMGRVLLVHDEHLGRDVALKELLPGFKFRPADDSTMRRMGHVLARFLQEARITGQLEHPSVVPVYELGRRADGSVYYTMKLVRGKTLAKALSECRSMRERLKLLPHFVDLCQAVAYAHSRGIIHRDIKPGNVMVGEFGETVVLDWGLARAVGAKDVHAEELAETIQALKSGDEREIAKTQQGEILGTPAYMSPEQARGDLEQIDERSDVYSLGAVLYELLTGRPPFTGPSVHEILSQVAQSAPAPPKTQDSEIPDYLCRICERALQKEPAARYRDARRMVAEAQHYTPQEFYLSPFRPSLTDMLPDIESLTPHERQRIIVRAVKRLAHDSQNLRKTLVRLLFTACCLYVFTYGFLVWPISLVLAAQRGIKLKDEYVQLRDFAHVAIRDEVVLSTAPRSEALWKGHPIVTWERTSRWKTFTLIVGVFGLLSTVYLVLKFTIQSVNATLLPYVQAEFMQFKYADGPAGHPDKHATKS